jgi:NTE family protein
MMRHGEARARWGRYNFALLCILLGLGACEGPAVYESKPAIIDPTVAGHVTLGEGGYRLPALGTDKTMPDLLLVLALSGGGKRSSAFSYGVLRGLRDMPIRYSGKTRRLLDQIDGIGSVSGGTFTAAYYGLHRDRIFTDYEKDFLKRDINSYIWGTYLLPWHWGWMFHAHFGTNDRMESVYDDLMFHGATYAELIKNGPPVIWIGATDISYGLIFTFNQNVFDILCTDLSNFPLARAVAASNGFPVLFSPINLKNHADQCGGWRPEWIGERVVELDEDTMLRRQLLEQSAEAYLDTSRTRYIHLADGGITDNLAMRNLINQIIFFESDVRFLRSRGAARLRRILFVSVDGEAAQDTSVAMEESVGGLGTILGAVSGAQIDRYNFETLSLARLKLADFAGRLKKVRCETAIVIDGRPCGDVESDVVHLSLAGIEDARTRERLEKIPTGLTIDDADVDALVAAGEEQVKKSPEIMKVIKAIERPGAVTAR